MMIFKKILGMDSVEFEVREKGQLVAFFVPTKKFSKTGIDKKFV